MCCFNIRYDSKTPRLSKNLIKTEKSTMLKLNIEITYLFLNTKQYFFKNAFINVTAPVLYDLSP